jgi:hypothetical protein
MSTERERLNEQLLKVYEEKLRYLRQQQANKFSFLRCEEISFLSIQASKLRRELSREYAQHG